MSKGVSDNNQWEILFVVKTAWIHTFTASRDRFFFLLVSIYILSTAWKVSKYEVFSGPYFSVFGNFSHSAIYWILWCKNSTNLFEFSVSNLSGNGITLRDLWATLNSFHITSLFFYPLKISEYLWFYYVYRG